MNQSEGMVGQAGTCVYPGCCLSPLYPITTLFSSLDQFIYQPIRCNVHLQKILYLKATIATTTTMSFALEFHDPERAALIVDLYGNISLGNGVMKGTPEMQAFLWTGDIESLRALTGESVGPGLSYNVGHTCTRINPFT